MFNNFVKWSTGRTNVKVIAVMLVMTLTFANFAILGSYLTESIARDNLHDTSTQSGNVTFSVYLDENDRNVNELSADINSEDITLYAAIKVENEGKLENAKISFQDSNFKLKDENEVFEKDLQTVYSGDELIVELPIVARKDSKYNLSLLNMQSKVVLTGEYIKNNGDVTPINSEENVKLDWNTNSVTKEQIDLSQEVITNKILSVDGENKRVVQILVKTGIQRNVAPVKSETIEIKSTLSNNIAQDAKVATLNTLAANGKGNIEFNNNVGSTYSFDRENNVLNVQLNNEVDENNNISWVKNAEDRLIITYIFDSDIEPTDFTSEVNVNYEIYGSNTKFSKMSRISSEVLPEAEDILNVKSDITKNIYKGNMYLGEETSYQTAYEVSLSYSDAASKIEIEDKAETFNVEGINTKYLKTTINKKQALNLLGENGTIKIYNAENKEIPLVDINISQVEEENITFEYDNEVSKIEILTSKPINSGSLKLVNDKVILAPESEIIPEITTSENNVEVNIGEITKNSTEVANVKEPQTTIEMNLDKNSISNQLEQTLTVTTILKTIETKNKLFKNPTLNIELPKEIEEVEIENIALLYEEELQIKSSEIKENEDGTKVIEIVLEGEQTHYNENISAGGANVVIDLTLKSKKFMANKNVEIKATSINDGEEAEVISNLEIKNQKGWVISNYLSVDGNEQEQIDKNILQADISNNSEIRVVSKIINNFGKELTNVTLETQIPEGLVLVSGEEKIEKETLAQAEMIEMEYTLKAAEDITQVEELLKNNLKITCTINEEEKEDIIQFIFNNLDYVENPEENTVVEEIENIESRDLKIEIKQKTENSTLHEGQIVTYSVNLKNIGNTAINNAKLVYQIVEGATYTELTYAQGFNIQFTDNPSKNTQSWTIEELKPGESIEKEVIVRVNKGVSKLVCTAKLVNENNETSVQIVKDTEVKPAQIEVLLSRRENMEIVLEEGSTINYTVIVKNVSQNELNNITVKSYIPENTVLDETSEYNKNWTYNREENCVYCTIQKIEKYQEGVSILENEGVVILRFAVKINNFEQNIQRSVISNSVIAEIENGEEYESNIYNSALKMVRWKISQESEHTKILQEGEKVKYIITVQNIGTIGRAVSVEDKLPDEIQAEKISKYLNNELISKVDVSDKSELNIINVLEPGEILKVEIEGKVLKLEDGRNNVNIENVARIPISNGQYLESNEIINTIIRKETPDNPDNPDNPVQPDKFSISGLAWLDENRDGIKNNNEEVLKGIKVNLLDTKGNRVKDENGNEITAETSLLGTYKFSNLSKGEYLVAFEYDNTIYSVTKYQVIGAAKDLNSDAISKEITLDGKQINIAVTDNINVTNSDVTNIDLGLTKIGEFDLRLDKYITKITVINDNGTTTYNFGEEKLAKIEISAKQFVKSTVIVEYEIKVTNEGDIAGYVTSIADYMPNELTFNSEMNTEWYKDSSGNLYSIQLEPKEIKPGESQTVKLVLTKSLTSNSAGTITNVAEIAESINLENISEKDSIASNKKAGEDDISEASLIISISTGGPALYIGIVLISLMVIGTGIYLIDKKVLKGGI